MFTQTNRDHWQSFYRAPDIPGFPSQFSVFVHSWLAGSELPLVELGCGNGRDAVFFHAQGRRVAVTDQVVGGALRDLASRCDDFGWVEGDVEEGAAGLAGLVDFSEPVAVYSRFFQHAIDERQERAVLETLSARLHADSMLFFEFRLAQDEHRPKVFGTDHYRRFQSADDFREVLTEAGLECVYSCEGHGYAVYGEEDPYVGRFVARKAAASRPALRIV